jgi:hypothetical protein
MLGPKGVLPTAPPSYEKHGKGAVSSLFWPSAFAGPEESASSATTRRASLWLNIFSPFQGFSIDDRSLSSDRSQDHLVGGGPSYSTRRCIITAVLEKRPMQLSSRWLTLRQNRRYSCGNATGSSVACRVTEMMTTPGLKRHNAVPTKLKELYRSPIECKPVPDVLSISTPSSFPINLKVPSAHGLDVPVPGRCQ